MNFITIITIIRFGYLLESPQHILLWGNIKTIFFILHVISTLDFPHFYYITLGENSMLLLYGEVPFPVSVNLPPPFL